MRRRRSSARSSNRGTSGFTLVEMLVAFSIASVVVVAVGSGFVFVTKSWTDQLGRVQTQQALRTTVESLTREMRLAGACMPSPTLPPIATTYDPYQPLTGTHGTTDGFTITSNPACAGPTSVTTPCNACTSIIVQNTTNFTAGTWAYIYNSDATTSPPGKGRKSAARSRLRSRLSPKRKGCPPSVTTRRRSARLPGVRPLHKVSQKTK